jgi:hypothetical protein
VKSVSAALYLVRLSLKGLSESYIFFVSPHSGSDRIAPRLGRAKAVPHQAGSIGQLDFYHLALSF